MSKSLKSFLLKNYPDSMDVDIITEVKYLNLRIPSVNYLLSGRPLTGGLPLSGKITTMYGPEGCGKTSFVLHSIALAQRAGLDVVYLDSERSITKPRLKQFNVDLDDLIYITPKYMEECFDVIEKICSEKADEEIDSTLIVWDSIAMTPTKDEIDRKAVDQEIAAQAKVLTRNLRRIRGKIQKIGAGMLFINQARDNQDMYGDLFKMPGGKMLQHCSDIILRASRHKPDTVGQDLKLTTPTKNRLFSPFQTTTIKFDYVRGFTQENIIDAYCEFLKQIEILGSAGAYCYLATDVQKLVASGTDEKEAVKQAEKFYKKDFVNRLLNDEVYYEQILAESEEYVNKNKIMVTEKMLDVESKTAAEREGIVDAEETDTAVVEKKRGRK